MKEYSLHYENTWLRGMVLNHEKWNLKVVLLHPINCWEKDAMIPQVHWGRAKDFLTERGAEVIEQMLITSYRMAMQLSRYIDQYCQNYQKLLDEKMALHSIHNEDLQERMAKKLEDWFFQKLFDSNRNGLIPNYYDRRGIIDVLEKHLKNNT